MSSFRDRIATNNYRNENIADQMLWDEINDVRAEIEAEKEAAETRIAGIAIPRIFEKKARYIHDFNEAQKVQFADIFINALPNYFYSVNQFNDYIRSMTNVIGLPRRLAPVGGKRKRSLTRRRKNRKQTRKYRARK